MSAHIDSSVLVRYLTGDDPSMAAAARRIVDEENLIVTDLVLAETIYVLRSVYEVGREEVIDALVALVRKQNVSVLGRDKDTVVKALLMCRSSGRVSPEDALLWAAARTAAGSGQPAVLYSFDKHFPSEGLEVCQSVRD